MGGGRPGGTWKGAGAAAAAGPAIAALGGAAALGVRWARGRARRRSVLVDRLSREACEARHRAKVDRIAAQLRDRRGPGPVSFKKRAVSHEVPKGFDLRRRDEKIDITDLDEIVEIDPVRRTCTAEPGVSFVDLVAATLRHGLVPVVVPELKTITIGGAVSGCALESTSFRRGGFHDSCLEYELITARGEVLTCTRENEHRLLFEMVHGSFGTLGVLSRLTFRLLEARPYVKVSYEKYATLPEYLEAIHRRYEAQDADFVDGFIHAPDLHVLSVGHFVGEAPYTHRYDWMRVYSRSTRERAEDYLATPDYFFRYDRGVTHVRPRSFLGRLFFGKLTGSTQVLWLAEHFRWALRTPTPTVIVDLFIPFSKVPEYLAWHQRTLGYYPLWCVPYRVDHPYPWLSDRLAAAVEDKLWVDLAIYGMKPAPGTNPYRQIEEKLLELGAVKTLISHNYYSEEEFWSTWNRGNYEAAKARVDPDNVFRGLYEKMCRVTRGVA